MNKDELTEVLKEVLHEHKVGTYPETHRKFVDMEIQRRESRKELWRRFKLSFVGGLALAVLGSLVWIGELVIEALKHGNHP